MAGEEGRWGRRGDGRDEEEVALKNEVNGRNQINTIITGLSVTAQMER